MKKVNSCTQNKKSLSVLYIGRNESLLNRIKLSLEKIYSSISVKNVGLGYFLKLQEVVTPDIDIVLIDLPLVNKEKSAIAKHIKESIQKLQSNPCIIIFSRRDNSALLSSLIDCNLRNIILKPLKDDMLIEQLKSICYRCIDDTELPIESQADEKLTSLKLFLEKYSHNIKEPFTDMLIITHQLSKLNLQKEEKELLVQLLNSSQELIRVTNSMLEYYYELLGSDTDESKYNRFNVYSIIDRVKSAIENRLRERGCNLIVDIDKDIPQYLLGEANQIEHIIFNILKHAIRHTNSNIQLLVRYLPKDNKRSSLNFKVVYIDKDNPTADTDENTLSDLHMAKRDIKLLSGDFGISHKDDKSIISFTLYTKNCESDKTTLNGYTVLIVDDNLINRSLIRALLNNIGVDTIEASSGKKAIELMKSECSKINLILMDISMPEMDGYETSKNILQIPMCQNVPIVALSANDADEKELQKAKSIGISDYLTKPIDIDALYKVLQNYLGRQTKVTDTDTQPKISTKTEKEFSDKELDSIEGIDIEDGLKRAGYDKEFYISILCDFCRLSKESLTKMREAFVKKDANSLHEYAHSLKGTSGNLGAVELFRIFRIIDDKAKENILDDKLGRKIELSIIMFNRLCKSLMNISDCK